jgi:hypothetical protein
MLACDYKQIRRIFLEPKVADIHEITFGQIDFKGLTSYLHTERKFFSRIMKNNIFPEI